MIPNATPLTHHLNTLVDVFASAPDLAADEFIQLDKASAVTVLRKLQLLTKQAAAIELELGILRHEEAGQQMTQMVEQLATSELGKMLDAAQGNVIRAPFGRKKDDK